MPKIYRDRKGRVLRVVDGIRGKGGFTTGWVWKGVLRKTHFRELDAPTRRKAQSLLNAYAKKEGLKPEATCSAP
jgi:hypothetical protein